MKLLLDQGLPISTATTLRRLGWRVEHVVDARLQQASDSAIINHAEADISNFGGPTPSG